MHGESIQLLSNQSIRRMLIKSGYSPKATQYYMEKKYMGSLPDADEVAEMTGTCGDTMKVYLKTSGEKIDNARFEVLGCAGAVSAAMVAAHLIIGKSIEFARSIDDGAIFRELEEVPVKKHHCIQLAVKTLHKALDELNSKKDGKQCA